MTTQEAIETLGRLKHYIQTDVNRYGGGWDSIVEAIDTAVKELEKPLPIDEIIKVKARTYSENKTDVNAGYILNSHLAFTAGAKWMRDLMRG